MLRKVFVIFYLIAISFARWDEQLIKNIRDPDIMLRNGDNIEVKVKTRDVTNSKWFINLQDGGCYEHKSNCPVYLQMAVTDSRIQKTIKLAAYDKGTEEEPRLVNVLQDNFPFEMDKEYKINFVMSLFDVKAMESNTKRDDYSYETQAIFDIFINDKFLTTYKYKSSGAVPLKVNHVYVGDNVHGESIHIFNGPQVPGMPLRLKDFKQFYENPKHRILYRH